MQNSICQNLDRIRQLIPSSTIIVAVSKQATVAQIRQAYAAGIRDFAENRLQVALEKQEQLKDLPDICWHFIGHIQSKKAKKIVPHFSWIHAVDSCKLAQLLDRAAIANNVSPKVCLQFKPLRDPDKFGWHREELLADLAELDKLKNLQIRGLMSILPLGLSDPEILAAFESVRSLFTEIKAQSWQHIRMQELSMGMSGDYALAVQAGATMIRPGRIIFS